MGETVSKQYKVRISSIGSADPKCIQSIATGLSLPVNLVANAVYRAPSILVDRIDRSTAGKLSDLLNELGFVTEVLEQEQETPTDPARLDVSLYVRDISQYELIVQRLAGFLSCSAEQAHGLISTPPGVVIGGVTEPTFRALQDHLGDGAELLASNPAIARYDLFLTSTDQAVCGRILQDLNATGVTTIGDNGCIARDLDQSLASEVWRRHARSGSLRIVNQDFMRCDIVLVSRPSGRPSEAQQHYLTKELGMPPGHLEEILEACPITLYEAESYEVMLNLLERLADLNFEVRADLVTFSQFGIEISSGPNPQAISDALNSLGVGGAQPDTLPYQLPFSFSELQARLLSSKLSELGINSTYFDPAEMRAAS